MSNNINFITSLNLRMNKEEKNETQNIQDNKVETKKLRTMILSKNVNDYDTGE
jgi:hypothetical protein